MIKDIDIKEFDYPLDDERIAKHPLAVRDSCKLLVYDRLNGKIEDHIFSEVADLLPGDAVLVCNNTRVINARLHFQKETGAGIEIFCLEPADPADYEQNFASTRSCSWVCLVGNSKRWKSGDLTMAVNIQGKKIALTATRLENLGQASIIKFSWDGDVSFSEIIGAAGEIPIPPYLNRKTESTDSDDYQTVYSHIEGSVAAPTAGLHFTPELFDKLQKKGIPAEEVTLHVGAGTFQPVKADRIGQHPMHSEFIAVPRAVIERLLGYIQAGRPIIAVGTTSVRTLESLHHLGALFSEGKFDCHVPQWYPYEPLHPRITPVEALSEILRYLDSRGLDTLVASTQIIIGPGYNYEIVKGMITNFHQPRSTLLLLVSAFLGGDRWKEIYSHALDNDYRFLSYGDACLFV